MGFQILTKLMSYYKKQTDVHRLKGWKLKTNKMKTRKGGSTKGNHMTIKIQVLLFLFYCYFVGSYWIRWIAPSLSRTPWINSPSANRSEWKREREGDNWTIFWHYHTNYHHANIYSSTLETFTMYLWMTDIW